MKKKCKPIFRGGIPSWIWKTLMFMKLTCLFILLAVFQSFATKSVAQVTQISVDLKNTTLENVLQTIEEESNYYFLYSRSVIDVTEKVDFKVDGANVEQALDQLFNGTNIDYKIEGRQIVLTQNDVITSYSIHYTKLYEILIG